MKRLRILLFVLILIAVPLTSNHVVSAGHATTSGAFCSGNPPDCGHSDLVGLRSSQDYAGEELGQEYDSGFSGTLVLAFTVLMIVTRLRPRA